MEYMTMYKVLIADDEKIEREMIRYLIRQNNFPLDVYEVENGEDALELMSEVEIDILITDIKMPFMDGMTLATIVKEKYPNIYIVFFSGYEDFSYAKKAMQLNAVNYILKPVDEDEFINTLDSVVEKIRKGRELIQMNEDKKRILHNHILQHVINGMDYSHLTSLYSFVDLSFLAKFHYMMIMHIKSDFGTVYSIDEDIARAEIIQKLLPEECLLHNSNPAEYVVFLPGARVNDVWYTDFVEKIGMQIREELNTECYVAVSERFSQPSEIFNAFRTTKIKVNNRFFENDDHYSGVEFSGNYLSYDQGNEIDRLMQELQRSVWEKDSQGLKSIVARIIYLTTVENKVSYLYFCYIMTTIIKTLLEVLPNGNGELFDECMEKLYHSSNSAEVERLMIQLIDNIADWIESDSSLDHVSNQIKTLIHTRYMEDLSLEILAKEVYLSPQYLSVLFSEKNGCGINKYIKNVRMNKAKELLENTNLKVNEICTKVGYSNYSYFCKCFAEEFGKTPKKYRDSLYS